MIDLIYQCLIISIDIVKFTITTHILPYNQHLFQSVTAGLLELATELLVLLLLLI